MTQSSILHILRSAFRIHHSLGQQGMALLTVMLLMVILTMIGIGTITMTGMESRIAGNVRSSESATTAADGCVGTAVNIIQQTIDAGTLPAAFLSNANPAGPVPQGNSATLQAEIMGQSDNNADTPAGSPNTSAQVNNFTVNGDIDRLYAVPKAGGSMQFAAGYEGSAGGTAGGGVDIMYRVDCVATNTAVGTVSRITAVYACTVTGESCQRKL
jgi:Tfp pilus assembly protein PilX